MSNIFGFAPITTRIAPTDTSATDVFGGAIIRVWGFSISNTSGGAATATIRTNESSPTTLWQFSVNTNTSFVMPIPFIADKGLEVMSSVADALSFTFWHSQVGS